MVKGKCGQPELSKRGWKPWDQTNFQSDGLNVARKCEEMEKVTKVLQSMRL